MLQKTISIIKITSIKEKTYRLILLAYFINTIKSEKCKMNLT